MLIYFVVTGIWRCVVDVPNWSWVAQENVPFVEHALLLKHDYCVSLRHDRHPLCLILDYSRFRLPDALHWKHGIYLSHPVYLIASNISDVIQPGS